MMVVGVSQAMEDPIMGSRKSGVAFGTSVEEASNHLQAEPYGIPWFPDVKSPIEGSQAHRVVLITSNGGSCCFEFALQALSRVFVPSEPMEDDKADGENVLFDPLRCDLNGVCV